MKTRKEKNRLIVNRMKRKLRLRLCGWIFFIVCAVFFIVGSVRQDEPLFLIGSLLFFLGCLFFVIPLVETLRRH